MSVQVYRVTLVGRVPVGWDFGHSTVPAISDWSRIGWVAVRKMVENPTQCQPNPPGTRPSGSTYTCTEFGLSLFPRLCDSPLGAGGEPRNLGKRL